MTSKGTDRVPAVVHRSHRGCLQLQPCWRPGWFQKILSIWWYWWSWWTYWTAYPIYLNTLCSQFINSQDYTNCIRTEDGFCGIEWKEKSGTSNGERKSKKLPVPRFEISLPQMLSTSSAQPQRSQRLLVQPWVSTFPTSGKSWNAFQLPRTLPMTWIFVSVTTESKLSPPPPPLPPLLPLTNTRVRFQTIKLAAVIYIMNLPIPE